MKNANEPVSSPPVLELAFASSSELIIRPAAKNFIQNFYWWRLSKFPLVCKIAKFLRDGTEIRCSEACPGRRGRAASLAASQNRCPRASIGEKTSARTRINQSTALSELRRHRSVDRAGKANAFESYPHDSNQLAQSASPLDQSWPWRGSDLRCLRQSSGPRTQCHRRPRLR